MDFTKAIVRKPGSDFAAGLTTADLGKPRFDLLTTQHRAYMAVLRRLGVEVMVLEPLDGYPDAYFVEDPAIITPEVAVITRPGAPTRRGETEALESVLAVHRPLRRIEAPGTVDGGDVLVAGKRVFAGRSERTNAAGIDQLEEILAPYGYRCTAVEVAAGLHLKSSVNLVGAHTLLLTREFKDHPAFSGFKQIILAPDEHYAGNTLWLNGHLLMPQGFTHTRRQLEQLMLPIIALNMSEVQKMDGGLTCLSLRF